jgi:hypothetical protein
MRRHISKPWTISAESWNDQAAGTVAFFLTETKRFICGVFFLSVSFALQEVPGKPELGQSERDYE